MYRQLVSVKVLMVMGAAMLLLVAMACGDEQPAPAPTPRPEPTPIAPGIDIAAIRAVVQEAVAAVPEGATKSEIEAMVQKAVADAAAAAPQPLSAAQMQQIVDDTTRAMELPSIDTSFIRSMVEEAVTAAVPEGVSAEEIGKMVEAAVTAQAQPGVSAAEVSAAVTKAVEDATAGQLTSAEVEAIVQAALTTVEEAEQILTRAEYANLLPAEEQVLRFNSRGGGRGGHVFPETCGALTSWAVLRMVFWPLVNIAEDHISLAPGLASSWGANDDYTQWTFNIDTSAKWSDGTDVTSRDIRRTIGYQYLQEQQCPWGGLRKLNEAVVGAKAAWDNGSADIPGIRTPDDDTLVFDLVSTNRFFGHMFVHGWFPTGFKVPDEAMNDPDPAKNHLRLIGTGPFKYKEPPDIDNFTATLVHNEHWWGPTPSLDRIEIVGAIRDPQSMLIGYLNNEWDMMASISGPAIEEQLAETPARLDLHPWPGGAGISAIGFRMDLAPFDDINVRRAFVHAIDYDSAAKALLEGTQSQPVYSLLPELPISTPKRPFTFDADLAKRELAESKYGGPDGLPPITMAIQATGPSEVAKFAQVFQQMWSQNLGVSVDLVLYSVADPEAFRKWQIFRTGEGFENVLDVAGQLQSFYVSESTHVCNEVSWDRGGQICEKVAPDAVQQRAEWKVVDDLIAEMQAIDPDDPAYGRQYSKIEDAFNDLYYGIPLYKSGVGGGFMIKPWVVNATMGSGYNTILNLESIAYIAPH